MACDPSYRHAPSVRRAIAEDAHALAMLQDQANAGQLRRTWGADGGRWDEAGAAELIDGATEMRLANTLVAVLDDSVVGMLNYAWNDAPPRPTGPVEAPFVALRRALGPCLYLRAMAVDPDHGSRGIATLLLDIAETAADTLGARALGVIVHEGNERLIAHYERRGFTEVAREQVRDHVTYSVGSELIALRKPVAPAN